MDPKSEFIVQSSILTALKDYNNGTVNEKAISLAVGIIILETLKENELCPV